jgi:hypothetical protein
MDDFLAAFEVTSGVGLGFVFVMFCAAMIYLAVAVVAKRLEGE